jgi:hypothetical protein
VVRLALIYLILSHLGGNPYRFISYSQKAKRGRAAINHHAETSRAGAENAEKYQEERSVMIFSAFSALHSAKRQNQVFPAEFSGRRFAKKSILTEE